MGLFDFFRKSDDSKSDDKDLARLQKMVTNKLSQNLDREDALHRLAQMKTAPACRVLLTRFGWNLDPSIKDNEEKELAVLGIVAAGEAAIEPIRQYCAKAEALTWPLKALRGVVGKERLESELLSLLDEFDTEYMRNPEPKVQLVQALGEFISDEVRVGVQPFLTDMSEEVRFAAVTTILGCDRSEALESLVAAMEEEESLRVKNRIALGLKEKGWRAEGAEAERLKAALPPGFRVEGSQVVGAPLS